MSSKRKADDITGDVQIPRCEAFGGSLSGHLRDLAPTPPHGLLTDLDEKIMTQLMSGVQVEGSIHPMFERGQFLKACSEPNSDALVMTFEHDWEGEYYDSILPALRVASLILTHDSQLPFWYGLMQAAADGKFNLPGPLDDMDRPSFSAERSLNADKTAATRAFLLDFAKTVVFTPDLFDPLVWGSTNSFVGDRMEEKWYKKCCRLWRTGTDGRVFTRCRFSPRFLNMSDDDVPVETQWCWQFNFANLLLHELAHAAGHYFAQSDYTELYFRDGSVCEMGHAYQNYVFGGITSDNDTIMEWPNSYLVNARNENPKGNLYTAPLTRDHCTEWPSIHHVHNTEYGKFFSAEFWLLQEYRPLPRALLIRRCCEVEVLDALSPVKSNDIAELYIRHRGHGIGRTILKVEKHCKRLKSDEETADQVMVDVSPAISESAFDRMQIQD